MKKIIILFILSLISTLSCFMDNEMQPIIHNTLKIRINSDFISEYKNNNITDDQFKEQFYEMIYTLIFNKDEQDIAYYLDNLNDLEENLRTEIYIKTIHIIAISKRFSTEEVLITKLDNLISSSYIISTKNKMDYYLLKFEIFNEILSDEILDSYLIKAYNFASTQEDLISISMIEALVSIRKSNIEEAKKNLSFVTKNIDKINNKSNKFDYYFARGMIASHEKNYLDAKIYYTQAIKFISNKNRNKNYFNIYINLANIELKLDDLDNAIVHSLTSFKNNFWIKNTSVMLPSLENISSILLTIKDYQKSIHVLESMISLISKVKAEELEDDNFLYDIKNVYLKIALAYMRINEYENAKSVLFDEKIVSSTSYYDQCRRFSLLVNIALLEDDLKLANSFYNEFKQSYYNPNNKLSHEKWFEMESLIQLLYLNDSSYETAVEDIANKYIKQKNYTVATQYLSILENYFVKNEKYKKATIISSKISKLSESNFYLSAKYAIIKFTYVREFEKFAKSINNLKQRNEKMFTRERNKNKTINFILTSILLILIYVIFLFIKVSRKSFKIAKDLRAENIEINLINDNLESANDEVRELNKQLKLESDKMNQKYDEKVRLEQSQEIVNTIELTYNNCKKLINDYNNCLADLKNEIDNDKTIKYLNTIIAEQNKFEEKLIKLSQINDPNFTSYTDETMMVDLDQNG